MIEQVNEKYPGRSVRRDGNQIVVTIPVKFFRRNGKQMVKARSESGNDSGPRHDINLTLATAFATAWEWQEELESGKFSSIEELADAKKVGRTYAGRLLRLTSLSPLLIEAILDGDESQGLSLRQLHKGIPLQWVHQQDFN